MAPCCRPTWPHVTPEKFGGPRVNPRKPMRGATGKYLLYETSSTCYVPNRQSVEWEQDMAQEQPETLLEEARRHVAEGEARCFRQTEILREMIVNNQPEEARTAQQVLAALEDSLAEVREHLRLEEERVSTQRQGAS